MVAKSCSDCSYIKTGFGLYTSMNDGSRLILGSFALLRNKYMRLLNISIPQEHAKKLGGILLSPTFKNSRTKLLWQCSKGYTWQSNWGHIQQGSWCPTCAGYFITNVSVLQEYAKSKNGKLKSQVYKNNRSKVEWECSKGHSWFAKWDDVKCKNSWCPKCNIYKAEEKVRQLLEIKLQMPLKKQRFYYDKHKFYELDGYNAEYKVAFEYNGKQHYVRHPKWHETEQAFINQQLRDRNKELWCQENNITLIIIPYTADNNLNKYIDTKLSEMLLCK